MREKEERDGEKERDTDRGEKNFLCKNEEIGRIGDQTNR